MKAAMTIVGIGIVAGYGYHKLGSNIIPPVSTHDVDAAIVKAFEEGSVQRGFTAAHDGVNRVERPDVEAQIELMLARNEKYGIIIGEKGTGKSTAVLHFINKKKTSPRGIIYVDCPENAESFPSLLGSMVHYRPQADLEGRVRRLASGMSKEEKDIDFGTDPSALFYRQGLRDHLLSAAITFSDKHKRPVIIIIDSADRLAREQPRFLKKLQELAKTGANMKALTFVFVASDFHILSVMESHGAYSRAAEPLEIGPISDSDAIAYLTKRYKVISEDEAKQAVTTITGGVFVELQRYGEARAAGIEYSSILARRDDTVRGALHKIGVDSRHPTFQKLCEAKALMSTPVRQELGDSVVDSLLASNILSRHADRTVTFHDRHVAHWFSSQFIKEGREEAKAGGGTADQ